MSQLAYPAFDADNHYYEHEDAFIRHIDPRYKRRAMQWADVNGRRNLLVAGKINRFIPNPTFDPVAKPGCLDEYFRGRNQAGKSNHLVFADGTQSQGFDTLFAAERWLVNEGWWSRYNREIDRLW